MDQYKVKAKSSSGGYYEVTTINSGSVVTCFCTCEAGSRGKLCGHKTGILDGDYSLLYDPDENDVLESIKSITSETNYQNLRNAHLHVKTAIDDLKRQEKRVRFNLEGAMKRGFDFV